MAVARVLGISSSNAGRMHVRTHRHRPFLIRRIHQAEESLGGIRTHGQQANVVDDDQPRAQDGLHGPGDRIVGAVATHQHAELLEAEPGHLESGLDGELTEPFQEERFASARWPAHHQVLVTADPLQRAQRCLGWCWDGGEARVPCSERLAGRESGFVCVESPAPSARVQRPPR